MSVHTCHKEHVRHDMIAAPSSAAPRVTRPPRHASIDSPDDLARSLSPVASASRAAAHPPPPMARSSARYHMSLRTCSSGQDPLFTKKRHDHPHPERARRDAPATRAPSKNETEKRASSRLVARTRARIRAGLRVEPRRGGPLYWALLACLPSIRKLPSPFMLWVRSCDVRASSTRPSITTTGLWRCSERSSARSTRTRRAR